MKSLLCLLFLIIATQAYTGEVKVYTQTAVPAFDYECDEWEKQYDPWCEFTTQDETPYAITWVDMLIPKFKVKTENCDQEVLTQKQTILSNTNPHLWGAKIKWKCDDKGKWIWRNPNFKWE